MKKLLIGLTALGVLLVGCGGIEIADEPESTTTTQRPTTTTTTTTTTAPPTTVPPTTTSTIPYSPMENWMLDNSDYIIGWTIEGANLMDEFVLAAEIGDVIGAYAVCLKIEDFAFEMKTHPNSPDGSWYILADHYLNVANACLLDDWNTVAAELDAGTAIISNYNFILDGLLATES